MKSRFLIFAMAWVATAAFAETNRLGIVVFQFDDGTAGHYKASQILDQYGLKGSFGVITGRLDKPGALTSAQVIAMHKAGHEIHDHTLEHDAAFYGNPANKDEWPQRMERSLAILKNLGITTRGWNHPGGKGQGWTPELRATLARYYDYVAGRVSLKPEQVWNIHWNLRDDPLCLGRGGVSSWGYNAATNDAAREAQAIKTKIADGIQQGLVTIALWHVVKDENRTTWSVEEVARFVRDHHLPTMRMADAVQAIEHTREHFDRQIEQMPNPTLTVNLNGDGRPDGYASCRYAPPEIKPPAGGRVIEWSRATSTTIYGPETGRTVFSFMARSADSQPRVIAPELGFGELNKNFEYTWPPKVKCKSVEIGPDWKRVSFPVLVGNDVDRVTIKLDLSPDGVIHLCNPSWRVATAP
jgi:peptidoglycan/xylan/chitin deacetylase (PgdA/CDA1 family)